nr:hypothetical protein GGBNIMDK_00141 [Bacillus cereus]
MIILQVLFVYIVNLLDLKMIFGGYCILKSYYVQNAPYKIVIGTELVVTNVCSSIAILFISIVMEQLNASFERIIDILS